MLRTLVIAVTVLAAAGCGTLSRPPAVDVVKLQWLGEGADIPTGASLGVSIAVPEPGALPGFATPRFAYLQRDLELRYYARHEWSARPARLLQPAVVRALDASGRFDAVIAPPAIALADLRLDLELTRLVHDFRESEGGVVVLEVRAQLTSLDDREVLATQRFSYTEPADAHPVAAARAADHALARLLGDLVTFCTTHAGG